MEEFGRGYTLHFDNNSIGRVKTVNDLGRITVNPIPYRFLTSLKIVKGNLSDLQSSVSSPRLLSVNHSNPSFYQITTNNETMKQCNNEQCTFAIIYLPQYLEYLGFGLLGISILYLLMTKQIKTS